jgi:hypothetical protein
VFLPVAKVQRRVRRWRSLSNSRALLSAAGHYFFRPEVLLANSDFPYLSAPRPIVLPGDRFEGSADVVRNTNPATELAAHRSRHCWRSHSADIRYDVSLAGETISQAGTPGQPDCHGATISAVRPVWQH